MPYLNIDLDFLDHPKTKRLTGLLGRGSEVLLIRLWSYCGKFHYGTGRLDGYSAQEVESLAGWWGKSGEMLQAMQRVGWMECSKDGVWSMHDWVDHQGHLDAFSKRGKLAAEARWARLKGRPPDATSIAPGNALSNAPTNQLTNQPTGTPPTAGAREEGSLVPDEAQAVAQAKLQAIPEDFGRYVFDDWSTRGGRDSAGNPVQWLRYVVKRWNRERKEWAEGTHKGKRSAGHVCEANMVKENLKAREL